MGSWGALTFRRYNQLKPIHKGGGILSGAGLTDYATRYNKKIIGDLIRGGYLEATKSGNEITELRLTPGGRTFMETFRRYV